MLGNGYLAYWELLKLQAQCKISPKWISGVKNVTADTLSRGGVPEWLARRGVRKVCNLREVAHGIRRAELSWNKNI